MALRSLLSGCPVRGKHNPSSQLGGVRARHLLSMVVVVAVVLASLGAAPVVAAAPASPSVAPALVSPGSGGAVRSSGYSSLGTSFTLTKTASSYSLPAGGGSVTYTYTVKNNNNSAYNTEWGKATPGSAYYQYSLFAPRGARSMSDDSCAAMSNVSGLQLAYNGTEYYIAPGDTATWSCTTTVTQDTTNTVTANFYDYYHAPLTAEATATVVIAQTPSSVSCNTLWWSSDTSKSYYGPVAGALGTFDPVTQQVTTQVNALPNFSINGSGYPGGSAAVAIDPRHPNRIYYIERSYIQGQMDGGLRRYDTSTRATSGQLTTPANTPNAVRLAFDAKGNLWTVDGTGTLWSWSEGASQWDNRGTLTIQAPHGYGMTDLLSGDIAFDGLGNLWVIGSAAVTQTAGPAYLFTVSAAQLAGADGAKATYVGAMTQGGLWFHGLAFDDSGTLYASADSNGSTYLYRIDKRTGAPDSRPVLLGANIADLASCALPKPELEITKTATPGVGYLGGGRIDYTIVISNLGNLEATGVTFHDLVPTGSSYIAGSTKLNGASVADVGGAMPYTVARDVHSTLTSFAGVVSAGDTATITFSVRAAANATKICNQGTATFTGSTALLTDDPTKPGQDDPTCLSQLLPVIGIDKSADKQVVTAAAGERVTYSYGVSTDQSQLAMYGGENDIPGAIRANPKTGNESLKNVVVRDDRCAPVKPVLRPGSTTVNEGDRNGDGILDPGEQWRYSCTTTVSAADAALGPDNPTKPGVLNTATATGTGVTSGAGVTDSDKWLVTTPVDAATWCSTIGFTTEYGWRDSTLETQRSTGTWGSWNNATGALNNYGALPVVGEMTVWSTKKVPISGADTAAMTPADPNFLYYLPEKSVTTGSENLGLYKIAMAAGATPILVSAAPAAPTNRLAFAPNGLLWSFANDGHLYSMDLATAAAGWTDHGSPMASDGTSFTALAMGDIAFDGTGTMWISSGDAATPSAAKLFTIATKELGKGSGITATVVGSLANVLNPMGMAFGADGTLYVSSDPEDGLTTKVTPQNGTGSIYAVNPVTAQATRVVGPSTKLGNVQDLASCAFPMPSITAEKTVSPGGTVRPGDVLSYTVTIHNSGNLMATNVQFTDPIPANTSYVAGSTVVNGARIADVDGAFPFAVAGYVHSPDNTIPGDVAAGASVTITYSVRVNPQPTVCTAISNQGRVGFTSPDLVLTDDPLTVTALDPTVSPLECGTPITLIKQGAQCNVSQPTCPLAGSTWALYASDPGAPGATPLERGITLDPRQPNGSQFVSTPLFVGKHYWLVETKAPDGFALSPDPVPFTMTASGIVLDHPAGISNSTAVAVSGSGLILTVTDVRPGTLPAAGGDGTRAWLLWGLALLALALGFYHQTSRGHGARGGGDLG